ncbi:hypothetical protein [Burkholderia gladioli]|uniref:hypothetical protein n=1 Tax=Burkholderia gladioli TaxID=28095 RepID=UPI001C24C5BC|nr:hypothetical protein [Burkholderia gladioli]MBU9190300.1 hypothetical protein [Burkholderia gladioli]MDD1789143.1 hypothetical protein [Burkholderia gladioli]
MPALITFAGGVIGAVIAQGAALFIASKNRAADQRKDAVRRAFDSAGSHIAKVTFDRYVEFCEAYVLLWSDALADLLQDGPTATATEHAQKIIRCRQQWILWVPPDVDSTLKAYEKALLDVGLNSRLAETVKTGNGVDIQSYINTMYLRFAELTGLGEWDGKKLDDDTRIEWMMQQLRQTLGTDSYNKLRGITMRMAIKDLEEFEASTKL